MEKWNSCSKPPTSWSCIRFQHDHAIESIWKSKSGNFGSISKNLPAHNPRTWSLSFFWSEACSFKHPRGGFLSHRGTPWAPVLHFSLGCSMRYKGKSTIQRAWATPIPGNPYVTWPTSPASTAISATFRQCVRSRFPVGRFTQKDRENVQSWTSHGNRMGLKMIFNN